MKCTHHNDIFRNTGIWYPYHSLGLLCLYDDAVLSFCNQSDPKVLRISLIQVSKADALHLSLELLPLKFSLTPSTITYRNAVPPPVRQCRFDE